MFGPARSRRRYAACGAFVAAVIGLLACADLFHGTDFRTKCDDDPILPGCPRIDVCSPDRAAALDRAVHACGMLSACEGPLGDNAPGRCMSHALAIFDCTATPNMLAHEEVRDAWRCLLHATTCGDVDRCVFSGEALGCSEDAAGPFTRCLDPVSGPNARVDCRTVGHPLKVEPCIATGRACSEDPTGTIGRCSSSPTWNTSAGTCTSGCDGTRLRVCDGDVDVGFDCAHFGQGSCNGGPPVGGACTPQGTVTCTPRIGVRCDGDVAVGCPAGVEERVDCAALSGPGPGTCNPKADTDSTGSIADVSRACMHASPCTADQCSGNTVQACVHGRLIPMPCPGGNKACITVSTGDGDDPRPTCSPL